MYQIQQQVIKELKKLDGSIKDKAGRASSKLMHRIHYKGSGVAFNHHLRTIESQGLISREIRKTRCYAISLDPALMVQIEESLPQKAPEGSPIEQRLSIALAESQRLRSKLSLSEDQLRAARQTERGLRMRLKELQHNLDRIIRNANNANYPREQELRELRRLMQEPPRAS